MEENADATSQEEPTDSRPPEQVEPSGPSRESLKPILEALLFAVEEPVSAAKLAEAIEGAAAADIRAVLQELQRQYDEEGRGCALEEIAGGFQLLSRSDYAPYLEKLQKKQKIRDSKNSMSMSKTRSQEERKDMDATAQKAQITGVLEKMFLAQEKKME